MQHLSTKHLQQKEGQSKESIFIGYYRCFLLLGVVLEFTFACFLLILETLSCKFL